ncbi:UNKNOWN [Stylonychia lemnae]|uniref:Uncharacterized protein n=1 Tax=Stylonychia lemnae TaxID=5949 RepID=A0A078AH08_STYLE|nr:UNKNOWN [Stylonychia lemnae]|eukprot:CDW81519.1 UNKNOWN [Stylonychia lemnae]
MSNFVRDYLQHKDDDFSEYIPNAFKMSVDEKQRLNQLQTQRLKFDINLAAACVRPCFKAFNTPVVLDGESECMINCIAKGEELLAIFEMNIAKE